MSGFGGNRENIVYCLVARGNIVLAEHTSTKVSGNFPTITRVLLQRIGAEDSRQSYQYDNYYFHYMVSNGITYLCMSEDGSKRRIPFSFLEDIRAAFVNDYGERAYTAIAYAMQEDFERVLQKKMHHYNSGKAQDKAPTPSSSTLNASTLLFTTPPSSNPTTSLRG
eukprot:g2836.t1